MRLNYDWVRSFLLMIEKSNDISGANVAVVNDFLDETKDATRNDVAYMVKNLTEAGFINGSIKWADNQPYIIFPGNLTFQGHEYLDSIRDPKIWKTVKSLTSHLESVSLKIVSDTASSVINHMIDKSML